MIQKFRLTLLTSMLLAASSVNATVLQETLNFTKSATDDNSYSITVDGYGIKVRPTKEDGPAEVNLRKLCKIRNFSQSPFGCFISEESDGNFPSGRN